MSDRFGIIDTSGRLPRISTAALATVLTGTVIWGWFSGFVGFLEAVGNGVTSALTDGALWLSGDAGLIAAVFGVAEAGTSSVARETGEFLAVFGPFAGLVSLVLGVFLIALIVVTITFTLRQIFEALP